MTHDTAARRRAERVAGFTLIELVTAVAIFSILASMLFQMIRGGLDVWQQGEGNRESIEKGAALIDIIGADLCMIRADSAPGARDAPVRLIADHGFLDLDLDDADESYLQRLRLVRSCPEERFDDRIRRAGDIPGGTVASSDLEEGAGQAELAPCGLAEVAYTTAAVPEKGRDPARLTLFRLFRTPAGGSGSLFENRLFDDPRRLCAAAVPLADNVLFLGFDFWSRDTRSWGGSADIPSGRLTVWDSTRGVLLDPDGFNAFLLARGADSLARTDDDVFPRRIRVTLTLARDEDETLLVRLTAPVTASATRLTVDSMRSFPAGKPPHPFLKIEGEWLEWTSAVDGELRVLRGRRNTAPAAHAAGARIHVGETFQKVFEIPVFREDWND